VQRIGTIENVENERRREEHLGLPGALEGLVFRQHRLAFIPMDMVTPEPHRPDWATAGRDHKDACKQSRRVVTPLCHQFVDRLERGPVLGLGDPSRPRGRWQCLYAIDWIACIIEYQTEIATPVPSSSDTRPHKIIITGAISKLLQGNAYARRL
jgi:hypothetical protein